MDVTLPVTHYAVSVFDYVPQRVFERYQEIIARNLKIDLRDAHVTVERVAEELGADRALAIQTAGDDQRKLLLDEARREILMKNVKAEISLADQHTAEREKVKGMVKQVRDGEKVLEGFDLGDLPTRDYALLVATITGIEAREEHEVGK